MFSPVLQNYRCMQIAKFCSAELGVFVKASSHVNRTSDFVQNAEFYQHVSSSSTNVMLRQTSGVYKILCSVLQKRQAAKTDVEAKRMRKTCTDRKSSETKDGKDLGMKTQEIPTVTDKKERTI